MAYTVLYKALIGSSALGASVDQSDKDYVYIYVEDLRDILSITHEVVPVDEHGDDSDISRHSLRHFGSLVYNGNPNMVFALSSPEQTAHQYFRVDKWLELLRTQSTIRRYHQLFTNHVKRYLQPPLGKTIEIPKSRKYLYDQFGYDVKAAYHLSRCGFEAMELAKHGKLVYPDDKKSAIYRKIRSGAIGYDEFCKFELPRIEDDILTAIQLAECTLPENADLDDINEELYVTHWNVWDLV